MSVTIVAKSLDDNNRQLKQQCWQLGQREWQIEKAMS